MSDIRPAPLVPAEVDLRDFAFMPLDVTRLFNSRFHAIANDAEWRAGVTLWCKSWQQVPCGSLPDDDVELCRLAELGRDMRTWRKLRPQALHGWVLCDDGRLYHPVVTEKAAEAWAKKRKASEKGRLGNEKRWGKARGQDEPEDPERQGDGSQDPASKSGQGIAKAVAQAIPVRSGQRLPEGSLRDRKGQGIDREWNGEESGKPAPPPPPPRGQASADPPPPEPPPEPAVQPTAYGAITRQLRAAGIARANPSELRFRALVDAGATAEEFLAYADKAKLKDDPFAYLVGTVEGERRRVAATAGQLHRGPMPSASPKPVAPWQATRDAADATFASLAGAAAAKSTTAASAAPTQEIVDGHARIVG